jgi:2',3'-cyclic-nucleotide 2'-phosphodiesterase (5'-nucleotidase family)
MECYDARVTTLQASKLEPDLIFINMADLHSSYDNFPGVLGRVQSLVREYEGVKAYILLNGDLFEQGNLCTTRTQGSVDWFFLEQLQACAPVVYNIGNHEFDFLDPHDFLHEAQSRGVTVLSNLLVDGEQLAPASLSFDAAGKRVTLVAVATNQDFTYPEDLRERITFPDPVTWFGENYRKLVTGSDYNVIVSHAGVMADVAMMAQLPSERKHLFVVGGHDHLNFRKYVSGRSYLHNGFKAEKINLVRVTFVEDASWISFQDYLIDPITEDGGIPDSAFANTGTRKAMQIRTAPLVQMIQNVRNSTLVEEDLESIGTLPRDFTVQEAIAWAIETINTELNVDVTVLNHTSFGAGLPEGDLPRYRFDEFLRFDSNLMQATVDSETLERILQRANQNAYTMLKERTGDFVYTNNIDPEPGEMYTLVTSSWVAMPFNVERYLNTTDIEFTELDGVSLKSLLQQALKHGW